jgi:hypothetical protein
MKLNQDHVLVKFELVVFSLFSIFQREVQPYIKSKGKFECFFFFFLIIIIQWETLQMGLEA